MTIDTVCGVAFNSKGCEPQPFLRYSFSKGKSAEWVGPKCKSVDQAFLIAMRKAEEISKKQTTAKQEKK